MSGAGPSFQQGFPAQGDFISWVVADLNGNILHGSGVAQVIKLGTGQYQVWWSKPFADANYCVLAMSQAYTTRTNPVPTPQYCTINCEGGGSSPANGNAQISVLAIGIR